MLKKSIFAIFALLIMVSCIGFLSATDCNDMDSNLQIAEESVFDSSNDCIAVENTVNQKDDLKISENVDSNLSNSENQNPSSDVSSSDSANALIQMNSKGTHAISISCTKEIRYGTHKFYVYSSKNAKGNISVEINGISCEVEPNLNNIAAKNKKVYPISGPYLDIGTYDVSISYSGDDYYAARTVVCKLSVLPKFLVYDSASTVSDTPSYKYPSGVLLKLPADANGKLVIEFYNSKNKLVKRISKKLVKGKSLIEFQKYNLRGKYSKMVLKYKGSDYKVKNRIIKKVRILPRIKTPSSSFLVGSKRYVSINLPGAKGVLKIHMDIKQKNGIVKTKTYSKKLVKGKAVISLSKIKPGTLSNIEFVETLKNGKKVSYWYVNGIQILNYVDMQPINYFGKAGVQIYTYQSGLKPSANKYVKVKINGKFVKKVKTDKNGYALYLIPSKYSPGIYRITAQYKKYVSIERIEKT